MDKTLCVGSRIQLALVDMNTVGYNYHGHETNSIFGGIPSVAFPSISTGVYGYPLEEAAPVALRTVIGFVRAHPEMERLHFVLHSSRAFRAFEEAIGQPTPQGL